MCVISNGTTDYTLLGTIDTDGATNTSIVISGTTRSTNAGNIQYLATASGASHIFYTASTTTRMTISSTGVNVNDNLGVSGRVGIATAPHSTYKLDVLGDINVSGAFRVNNIALANSWLGGTPTNSIYYSAGNVGIGTNNPLQILQVGGGGRLRIANNNTDYSLIGVDDVDGVANTRIVISGSARTGNNGCLDDVATTTGVHRFYTTASTTEQMRIANNGYVGIGTASPAYKLHIKCSYNDVATGLHLDASDNTQYTLTIWPYVQGGGQVGWKFRTISFDGGTNTPLQFYHNGNVLIPSNITAGSMTSSGTIQASGAYYFANGLWNNSNEGENRIYFASSSTTYIRGAGNVLNTSIVFRSPNQTDMANFTGNVFYCYGPINLSDRRIKRDIVEIDDETALNMLLLVQPTTYYYKDEARNKGNGKVYGFIAQQIKEVIPDAVNITRNIIPNIYKTCLVYNKREIYYSIPQDVAIDTEVHILDKEGGDKGKRYKIKEIHEDHFVIDEDIEGDDCFVFGYCIDDLHGLDKSYIYTLNVCATQELHRRIEAQDKRIKELETKLEKLINYIYQ